MKPFTRVDGLVMGAVAALALTVWAARMALVPAALPVYGEVPAFAGVNAEGRAMDLRDLRGGVWVADFIFTRCAGQCPMMSERMAALQRTFDGMPVRLLSFSVDPAHDTSAALAAYGVRYGARPGRWDLLTGDPDAIARLAQDGFRLAIADGGPPQEPIVHSVRLVLVDQRGRIRGYYDATDAAAVARLQRDARSLARRDMP